jgi:acyl carrier protein
MTNLEKYQNAFCESFQIENSKLKGLSYQSIPTWDSVGHMALIATLEQEFDIMMETDHIIDLSTYEKGMEILINNYEIIF